VSKNLAAIRRATVVVQAGLFALLVLASCALQAQIAGTGQISGTVADSSGAVVPNATVTLINKATQVQRVKQSDKAGAYLFPNIEVGTYDLSATAQGFETYVQTGIVLEVGSDIAVNPALAVGKADIKVEVHAEGLALQTEDASFKQTIDQQDVEEMPLNGRQMTALITLSGGSSPAPGGDFTGSKYSYQVVSVSVAGGMGNTTEWKLDGGDNNDYMGNGNLPFPFPDAVAQFSVESSALGAAGGKHSGGLVNVVTRSGTNSYHGTAFEFIRNNYIDATNFFASGKDSLHQNQYGGTFGGKILRDKLFAFAAYQRLGAKQATALNSMYIPTADNLSGDWSHTDPPPGSTSPCGSAAQLYDPNTGQLLPGNKYPTAPTYNASALALEKYFPAINPAIDTNNCGLVKFAIPSVVADNQFVTRVDYTINPRNNFYARYMIDGYQAPSFFFPGGGNNGGILVTFSAPGNYERVQTATVNEAFTWTSNLVNSFHASGTKRVNLRQSAPGINASNIGITSYTELATGLQIADATSGKNHNWSTYCGTCSNGFFNVDDESVADDLTWIKGQHQIVVGGEYVRVHFNEVAGYEANGTYTFNGEFSANGPLGGTAVGDSNLDFLGGALSSFQQSKEQQLALRGPIPSIYLQDTYHATKKLTIVAGIRWSPEFMPFDNFNRGTTFSMAAFQSNLISSVYPTAPAGVGFYGDPGVPRADTKSSPLQFNPNFGATWDPFGNGNTVIRGGLMLVYDEANFYTGNRVHQNPPFATAANPAVSGPICFSEPWLAGGTGYGCNQVGASNTSPFPQAIVPTPTTAIFPSQGQFIVLPTQFHVSDTFQWTFSIQHEFARGWQAQVDYIGNKTSNMETGTPLSPAIYTPGVWGANATGCGPVVTTGPAAKAAGTLAPTVGSACSTTKNQQARFGLTEANPAQGNQIQGGGAGSVIVNDTAYANYNGLVASLNHRLSSTFSLLSNFTWSKCLNITDAQGDITGTQVENIYNYAQDYGRCGSDYRKVFNTTVIAKSEFKNLPGAVAYIVNHWELGPLFHIVSGAPINITDGSDISLTDTGNDRPNFVYGVKTTTGNKITSAAATPSNRAYLNLNAFCSVSTAANPCANAVAPGTFGNLGRNTVSGPMFFQFDAQLSRSFPIGEKLNVLLRLEGFNVLNHPDFANPGASGAGNSTASNPSSGSFGEITATANSARVFQGGLKVSF
jgi:hypothetical protein